MSKFAGFNQVQLTKPKKSQFDLSHQKRISARMGKLFPVFISECVPSDQFSGNSEILVRVAPLLAPIYDLIQLFVHFFFVPNRILWEEWETFITGGRLGVGIDPVNAPVPPWFDMGIAYSELTFPYRFGRKSDLSDYMGIPILADLTADPGADYEGVRCDMMPFAAYQRVWFDYYRDRNYVPDDTSLQFPLQSGEQLVDFSGDGRFFLEMRTRAYAHDYFTSALPFTQRGEEVLMPLAGTGSVTYLNQSIIADTGGTPYAPIQDNVLGQQAASSGLGAFERVSGSYDGDFQIQNIDEVNLDSSSVSINDFRSAYALQVWLERNAIGGSRYTESTQAHFGVRPQDSRLQRAEYIGGGRIPIKISEVVSTAYSSDGSATVPLANLGGHGIAYGNTNGFRYFCPEHGFIIGIASIMAPGSYHQGMPRMFRRRTFLDYPWPTFAKLGEQTVEKYELFASPVNLTEDVNGQFPLFGYQSRYADWKHIHNSSHGDFHDDLLFWTLTRDFANSPSLGESFVTFDETTQDRIFAVSGPSDNFWLYVHNKCRVYRPLPYFGTPNTLGFV